MPYTNLHLASWRWMRVKWLAGCVAAVGLMLAAGVSHGAPRLSLGSPTVAPTPPATLAPSLGQLAAAHPNRSVEVIVQLRAGVRPGRVENVVREAGGKVTRDLHIINGFAARLSASAARHLVGAAGVWAVSPNATVRKTGLVDPSELATAYNQSIRAEKAWSAGYTGRGIGVAVVDTGIAGNLADFRVSQSDGSSRVIASAVVNPSATTAGDTFGHGTHVAGLIAGNGTDRSSSDPLYGKYAGVAPDGSLIAIKAGDDHGSATVLDVIEGVQFAVDHRADYNIRVLNLSLKSSSAESYRTDPLDAAVESAWNSGIVVVAAAGNLGTAADSVSYAPANDPYVITVGGVDDAGTKSTDDDTLASWSSRGTTQDGFAKPDVLAPAAHLVSTLAPGSDYASLCPSCVTDGAYFKVGGTSMAAGVVSGAIADILQAHPDWTPNQVKSTLVKRSRTLYQTTTSTTPLLDSSGVPIVDALGSTVTTTSTSTTAVGQEIALDKVLFNRNGTPEAPANGGLTPNQYIDPSSGQIDYTRASWSRASWSDAVDPLRASWSRASWSRASWSSNGWTATPQSCSDLQRASWSRASWSDADIAAAQTACTSMDPTRASWSGAAFSRASWSSSFDK